MRAMPIALLLLASAVGGCSTSGGPLTAGGLFGPARVEAEQIDRWVADGEYGRALEALNALDPSRPDYAELAKRRAVVREKAERFERETIARADEWVAAGDWAGALDAYDAALAVLPSSAALRDALAALHERQRRARAEQEQELLLERARWLTESLAEYEQIARIAPRDSAAREALEAQRREALELGEELARHGLEALERGDIPAAERRLSLAAGLADSAEVQEGLAQVGRWHKERRAREQAERARRTAAAEKEAEQRRLEEQAKVEERQRLLAAYREAVAQARYADARELLPTLAEDPPPGFEPEVEMAALEAASDAEVQRLFQAGIIHYGREEFEPALELWRRVLELQPDHPQVKEHITRAERVLEKLEELRAKQAERQ